MIATLKIDDDNYEAAAEAAEEDACIERSIEAAQEAAIEDAIENAAIERSIEAAEEAAIERAIEESEEVCASEAAYLYGP